MKRFKVTELLIWVISAELAGAVSALLSGGDFSGYYAALVKPPIAPPGWVFPIAWAILYALTALGAYIVSLSESDASRLALRLYALQLGVNFLWSPIFFGLKSFGWAVAAAAVLFLLVVLMTLAFFRADELAVASAIPYLLWVGYALYLSTGFLVVN